MEETNEQVELTPQPQEEAVDIQPMSMAVSLSICAAGWLVPGLGHVLLRRWIRGLIFIGCVLLMFGMGLAMSGKLYDLEFDQPLHVFAFIANAGAGLLYIAAVHFHLGIGTMTAPSYDYGTTFLWVSGLLNYLIVLDVFDIAQGRKP